MRLRTATGTSELRTFYIGALPETKEAEPNSEFAQPQKIALGTTVNGVVDNEDVDFYLVEAKKGERISAEIEGIRLGYTFFDPYVAILDMQRFELASSDDAALVWQDGVVAAIAPEDGTYMVQVRETAYGGIGSCTYRLHVGKFPRPRATVPAGGKYGETLDVRFLGDVAGERTQQVTLPAGPTAKFGIFAQDEQGIAPSPNVFRLGELGNVIEAEPNNDPTTATKFEAPLALAGVISQPGDVDCFKFTAKKGQQYDVRVLARGIRSPLDPVLTINRIGGAGVAGNDDSGGPDSYIRLAVPEDDEYVIYVQDHLQQGGRRLCVSRRDHAGQAATGDGFARAIAVCRCDGRRAARKSHSGAGQRVARRFWRRSDGRAQGLAAGRHIPNRQDAGQPDDRAGAVHRRGRCPARRPIGRRRGHATWIRIRTSKDTSSK